MTGGIYLLASGGIRPRSWLHYVLRGSEPYALCGRQVHVTGQLPEGWWRRQVCSDCQRKAVVCPECGGPAETNPSGLVLPHGVWRVGRLGLHRTGRWCPGSYQTAAREEAVTAC